jgi:hypothetical protein
VQEVRLEGGSTKPAEYTFFYGKGTIGNESLYEISNDNGVRLVNSERQN